VSRVPRRVGDFLDVGSGSLEIVGCFNRSEARNDLFDVGGFRISVTELNGDAVEAERGERGKERESRVSFRGFDSHRPRCGKENGRQRIKDVPFQRPDLDDLVSILELNVRKTDDSSREEDLERKKEERVRTRRREES